jgi:uncharacterized protein (DUF4415 family)
MKTTHDKENPPFDIKSARRVTSAEHARFHQAYVNTFGKEPPVRRGHPFKKPGDLYKHVHMRIKPTVLARVRAKALKKGIGYQTLINQILERAA